MHAAWTRKPLLLALSGIATLTIHCGGLDSNSSADRAPSEDLKASVPAATPIAEGSTPTRLTLKGGADNFIQLHAMPDSACELRDQEGNPNSGVLHLASDDRGLISFSFKPAPDSTSKLRLSCVDTSGSESEQIVELNASNQVEALTRAPRAPRVGHPLDHPESCTDEELRAANLPERPDPKKSPQLYEMWRQLAESGAVKVPVHTPSELSERYKQRQRAPAPEVKDDNNINSNIWSGYDANQQNCSAGAGCEPFDVVFGQWTVPTLSGSISTWIGLGGYDGSPLFTNPGAMFQGGTATNQSVNLGNGQGNGWDLWIEMVGYDGWGSFRVPLVGATPLPGDDIYAVLWFQPPTGTCGWSQAGFTYPFGFGSTAGAQSAQYNSETQQLGYFYWDTTSGYYVEDCINVRTFMDALSGEQIASTAYGLSNATAHAAPISYPTMIFGGSVQWILERTAGGNGALPDFGEFQFRNPLVIDKNWNSYYYYQLNGHWDAMYQNPGKPTAPPPSSLNGNLLAFPGYDPANYTAFDIYWYNY